jgi:hypothetical protein
MGVIIELKDTAKIQLNNRTKMRAERWPRGKSKLLPEDAPTCPAQRLRHQHVARFVACQFVGAGSIASTRKLRLPSSVL